MNEKNSNVSGLHLQSSQPLLRILNFSNTMVGILPEEKPVSLAGMFMASCCSARLEFFETSIRIAV
jgi:hypothetical protein